MISIQINVPACVNSWTIPAQPVGVMNSQFQYNKSHASTHKQEILPSLKFAACVHTPF